MGAADPAGMRGQPSAQARAAADHLAALRAAEEARRRAEETARRAAQEARRAAEAARRAAEEARRKAEDAKRAADAAEAQAQKSRLDAARQEATRLRTAADAQEVLARRHEATADLKGKEQLLADSRLDDVRQGRKAADASDATRSAQVQVDAARKSVAMLDAPTSHPPSNPLKGAGARTRQLLARAQDAAKPVFEAQDQGRAPTAEQQRAYQQSLNDWLAAAEHEMRLAGVEADARGGDPAGAMQQRADGIVQDVADGGVFDPASLGRHVQDGVKELKAENPRIRQLQIERHDVLQEGQRQLDDARGAWQTADAAADRAETYADGYTGARTDSQATARDAARAEATRLRDAADATRRRLDSLVRLYGNGERVGTVVADYDARLADLELEQAQAAYQRALGGRDQGAIDAAYDKLGVALDGQRLARAIAGDERAQLDLADADTELAQARAAWEAEKANQPQARTVEHRGRGGRNTSTIEPDGYDRTFWLDYGRDKDRVRQIDGTYYLITRTGRGHESRQELNPVTARLWAAHERQAQATTQAGTAAEARATAMDDVVGDDAAGPKLDATLLDPERQQQIGRELDAANRALADARGRLGDARPPGFIGPVTGMAPAQYGALVERQRAAQANADALQAMKDLRQAEIDRANGKPVDDARITGLRDKARTAAFDAREAQPELSAEQEREMRDTLLPQARERLRDQDATIARLRAEGKDTTRAANERDRIELEVLDYETQLDLIEAERSALAAPERYEQAARALPGQGPFVKPQLSMFSEKRYGSNHGDAVTADIYADNYDPTWSIRPGDDGQVSAEGLPRGLKPEDVEVEFVCDTWYVTFKKDSEVLGRRTDLTTNYVVQEGRYRMHPTTAQLWRATNEDKNVGATPLVQAREAREKLEQRLQRAADDAGPPDGAQPVMGPGGRPVPALHFGDDLGTRRQAVQGDLDRFNEVLATAERDKQAGLGDPEALQLALDEAQVDVQIARAELSAIDAAIAWQQANRLRQDAEAAEREGRGSAATQRERADELRDAAEAARSRWTELRSGKLADMAQRKLDRAEQAHAAWQQTHPGQPETASETWTALQAARDEVDAARRMQTAGALEGSRLREQAFISRHLKPGEHDDPRALYRLFMQDPRTMAQSIINAHYVEHGGRPLEATSRTHLFNEVAFALGDAPTRSLDPNTPEVNQRLRLSTDLFAGLHPEKRKLRDAVVDRLTELGGEHARVTVLPVVYGLDDAQGGIVKTALFKVERSDGSTMYVDDEGDKYTSLDDFRGNNALPVDGVQLVMPEDGSFSLDEQGNVKLFVGDARTESGWESFRREYKVDLIVQGAGLVAGAVLLIGSGGTLAPVAAGLVYGTLALTTGYGVVTSMQNLHRSASHGRSINPITDAQARMDYISLAGSLPGARSLVAMGRASTLARQAATATHLGRTSRAAELTARAEAAQATAVRWGVPTAVTGVAGMEEAARYAAANWEHMTPEERRDTQLHLVLGGVQFIGNPATAKLGARAARPVIDAVKPVLSHAKQWVTTAPDNLLAAVPLQHVAPAGRLASDALRPFRSTAGVARNGWERVADWRTRQRGTVAPESPPPEGPSLRRRVWDRVTRLDELKLVTALDRGRVGNVTLVARQMAARRHFADIERAGFLRRAEGLNDRLGGGSRLGDRGEMQLHLRRARELRDALVEALRAADATQATAAFTRLQDLERMASPLGRGWRSRFQRLARAEARTLETQAKSHKHVAQSLKDSAQEVHHLRGQVLDGAERLKADLAAHADAASAPLRTRAEHLVRRLERRAEDIDEGITLTQTLLGATRDNQRLVLETPDANGKTTRQKLEAEIHVVAPGDWNPALNPDPSVFTRRGGGRHAGQPPAHREEGLTFRTLLRSEPSGYRTGASNRFHTGAAYRYSLRAETAAAKARDASNAEARQEAWTVFADKAQAQRGAAGLDDSVRATLGSNEYQGGALGSVRRFAPLAQDADTRAAYVSLRREARKASARATRMAVADALRAWRGAWKQAALAQRDVAWHESRLQAYRTGHRIEADAPLSRTGDPQHWRLTRDLTLAREASRHALKSAQATHDTVFGRGGALDQLRSAHPAAYARLAQRAARHAVTQLRRVPTRQPALRALVDDARSVAARASTELADARQESRLHAIGDAGLSMHKLWRDAKRLPKVAALAYGGYTLATGEFDVNHDPQELRKYNLPITGSRYEDYSYQVTFKSRDGLLTVSAWLNTLGIKSLFWSVPQRGLGAGLGATTPYAYRRNGTTTVETRDGVNLLEGGLGYRFGSPTLNRMGMFSLRIGHLSLNPVRADVGERRVKGLHGQLSWSYPVTLVMEDFYNIGPVRTFSYHNRDRVPLFTYRRNVGAGERLQASGFDGAVSRVNAFQAFTINREFRWPAWRSPALPPDGSGLLTAVPTTGTGAPATEQAGPAVLRAFELPRIDVSTVRPAQAAVHEVRPGDSLSRIARLHAGELLDGDRPRDEGDALRALVGFNPDHGFDLQLMDGVVTDRQGDPDRLLPGWLLRLG